MNRRAFLASLPFIPAGVKAALGAAPARTFTLPRAYEVSDEQLFNTIEKWNPANFQGAIMWDNVVPDSFPLRYNANGKKEV